MAKNQRIYVVFWALVRSNSLVATPPLQMLAHPGSTPGQGRFANHPRLHIFFRSLLENRRRKIFVSGFGHGLANRQKRLNVWGNDSMILIE